MIIGKWNKSVILTYVGLCASILGMLLALGGMINYAFICLIVAGICDLFDGYVARKCERTEEEKQFGIELDSLVDIVNFGIFPIIICISLGFTKWYSIVIYFVYTICQIARLAYFNISLDDCNKNEPVKCYTGLPVTASAFILPLSYILLSMFSDNIFNLFFQVILLVTAILNILKIKIQKPKGIAYLVFTVMAVIAIIIYGFVI